MIERKLIQDVYIRVCRDSNWNMPWDQAARFVADMLNIHPLAVGNAFPYIMTMQEIAAGIHPVCETK